MTEQASWVPDQVNEEIASAARVYDYLLGGGHNFAADRGVAENFIAALPSACDVAQLNRAFLRRAVVYLMERGIRQFLDIGSGIPTVGNVHEIVQEVDPDADVVYVDNEPIAVAHSQLLLEDDEHATVIEGDLHRPGAILDRVETGRLLDLSQPVGLLMVGVFHFVGTESDAPGLVSRYRDALAPGSFLALSHFTADVSPSEMAEVVRVMSRTADPIHTRTHPEIEELFTGFDLVQPGVVGTALWRPESRNTRPADLPGATQIYAGVGRKHDVPPDASPAPANGD